MSDISTWIAIISAIAALAAAWYTFRAAKIAQKSLELALQQEQRQRSNLELYLIDGHIKRFRNQQFRIYTFNLSITNKSDADNSLKDISLIIEHNRGQEPGSSFVVPHDHSLAAMIPSLKAGAIQIPSVIEAHETLVGYALFRVHDDLLYDSTVESYTLKVVDSDNMESQLEPILLVEFSDEK